MEHIHQGNYHIKCVTFKDNIDEKLGQKELDKQGYELLTCAYDNDLDATVHIYMKPIGG